MGGRNKREKIKQEKMQNIILISSNVITKAEDLVYNQDRTHFMKGCYRHLKKEKETKAEIVNNNRGRSKEWRDRFFIKLYNERKEKEKKQLQLTLEQKQKSKEVYTFEPSLYNSTMMLNRVPCGNFIERLKAYEELKNLKLSKIKNQVDGSIPMPRETVKSLSCTIIKDLSNYHSRKKEKIRQIEISVLREQGITFRPVLNSSRNEAITSNIIKRGDELLKAKFAKKSILSSREVEECTFTPRINTSTISHLSETKVGDRLFQYQNKYKKKLEEKKESYTENYSFKPEISKNAYEIVQRREERIEEIKKKIKYREDNKYKLKNKTDSNEKKAANQKEHREPFENILSLFEENTNHPNIITASPSKQIVEIKTNMKISQPNSHVHMNTNSKSEHLNPQENPTTQKRQVELQSLSNSKILECANQYITTDESIKNDQRRFREKCNSPRKEENYFAELRDLIKDNVFTKNKGEGFPEEKGKIKSISTSQRQSMPISKKIISCGMEYYESLC